MGRDEEVVALADGHHLLSRQYVERTFDDEEDLGRALVMVGRWSVSTLRHLRAGGANPAIAAAVRKQLDRVRPEPERLGIVSAHEDDLLTVGGVEAHVGSLLTSIVGSVGTNHRCGRGDTDVLNRGQARSMSRE